MKAIVLKAMVPLPKMKVIAPRRYEIIMKVMVLKSVIFHVVTYKAIIIHDERYQSKAVFLVQNYGAKLRLTKATVFLMKGYNGRK